MKTDAPVVIVLGASAAIVGCKPASQQPSRPAPATRPSPATEPSVATRPAAAAAAAATVPASTRAVTPIAPPPLVFQRTAARTPLKPERLQLILRQAARVRPDAGPVWFVAIDINYDTECTATVYYPPTATSPRLRSGPSVYVFLTQAEHTRGRDGVQAVLPREYVQVSPSADEPWEPAGPVAPVPPTWYAQVPFRRPTYDAALRATGTEAKGVPRVRMSDQQVVELVDAARRDLSWEEDYDHDPICYVAVKGKGQIIVSSGTWDFGGAWVEYTIGPDGRRVATREALPWSGSLPWR